MALIYPNSEIIWENREDCTLIVRSEHDPKPWTDKRLPYICWNGESGTVDHKDYPPICELYTHYRDTPGFFLLPFIVFNKLTTQGVREYTNPLEQRPNFVAFFTGKAFKERDKLFLMLKQGDKTGTTHGLGLRFNSFDGKTVEGGWDGKQLIEAYSKYRFVFAMENIVKKGYVTEKIINAYKSGAIPIYWGDSEMVKKYFNPKSFVCVNDFPSLVDCSKYILELDNDPIRLKQMMAEPVFNSAEIPDLFRIGDIENPPKFYTDMSDHIKTKLNFKPLCDMDSVPGFTLYKGTDSLGCDYQHVPNKTIDEMLQIAQHPLCIAFNTKGYFKFNIQNKEDWLDIPDSDLYVHTDRLENISTSVPSVLHSESTAVEVPKIFHFIWFSKGRGFNMIHYLCIKSAYNHHPGYKFKLHCDAAPPADNFWFQKIKPFVIVDIREPVEEINGHPVQFFQHKADVLRLDVLLEEGGIYSDIDNLFIKSIDSFRSIPEGLLLSYDRSAKKSVGNHLILSIPNHRLLQEWRQIYDTSWGTDMIANWFGHSTLIPYELSVKYPHLMHKQEAEYFCPFLWNQFNIFRSVDELPENVHSMQLFETEMSKYDIVQHDMFYFTRHHNRFTILFKKYMEELPEWEELNNLLKKYDFYPKKDSPGNDIVYLADLSSIIDLLREAEGRPNCNGFNTKGWFKQTIVDEVYFETIGCFKERDGLFVKKQSKIRLSDKFQFFEKLDSVGCDIAYEPNRTIAELMTMCATIPDCVAFNTLGFMKKSVGKMTPSKYFSDKDGLYVHIDKSEKVVNETKRSQESQLIEAQKLETSENCRGDIKLKIIGDWANPTFLMNYHARMLKASGRWNNIILTDAKEADYYVIINSNECDYYDPATTVVFQMEPMRLNKSGNYGVKAWGKWAQPDRSKFLQVRDHAFSHNNSEWHLNRSYSQLLTETITKTAYAKQKVSAVTSDKRLDEGHDLRLSFLKYIEDMKTEDPLSIDIDIWGKCSSLGFKNYKGELPNLDKVNGLYPYKYTIALENNSEDNYFTEKINDAILAECLCFYWGCPNLEDYFHDAKTNLSPFIRLELKDFAHDYKIIQDAIQNNEWERRLPAIKAAKTKILNELHIMPVMEGIIRTHRAPPLIDTYFDRIIIINLKKCQNRWKKIVRQMANNGITNYERFDAIDTEKSKSYNWPIPMSHKDRPNINYRAQLACKLSHWEVIRLAKARGYKRVLILEDDAILEKQQVQKCNLAINELITSETKWDMLWMYCRYHRLGDRCGNYLWRLQYSVSAACYAVAESCYDQVLADLEKYMNYPVDDIFCNFIHHKLQTYCFNPNIFGPDQTTFSTITINSIFDKIRTVCINLERRPDRREKITSLLDQCDIGKFEFFNAVDGRQLKCTEEIVKLFKDNDFEYRRGFIGCALSHYKLWEELQRDTNYDNYLIFEDDAQFCDNFKDLYMTAITDLSTVPDWDVLCLGQSPKPRCKSLYSDYGKPLTMKPLDKNDTIGGMFGYLINKKGVHKLMQYIKENGIRHGIDYLMMRLDIVKVYEVIPHIVTSPCVRSVNDGVDSDIQRTYDSIFDGN